MLSERIERVVLPKDRTYPYLAELKDKRDGLVVLFVGPGEGVVVNASKLYKVGYQSRNWQEDGHFSVFNGAVKLSND